MIDFQIKQNANGFKYHINQTDDSGYIIQFLKSAGTFKTREQASIAMTGVAKELKDAFRNDSTIAKLMIQIVELKQELEVANTEIERIYDFALKITEGKLL